MIWEPVGMLADLEQTTSSLTDEFRNDALRNEANIRKRELPQSERDHIVLPLLTTSYKLTSSSE